MIKKVVANTLLMLLFATTTYSVVAHSAIAGGDDDAKEWRFRVYLGDSAIGHHVYRLTQQGDSKTLVTEADFKVQFLFFTAYRYQHSNTETWEDECLQQIESHTDANGRILNVRGLSGPQGFLIDRPDTQPLPGCVKSFAYWDQDILDEDALLNPQTGELTPVEVSLVAEETLRVRGRAVPAHKYRLRTRDLVLDVWYSEDSEWLALESTTKDGRKLRYELI